MPRLGAIGTLVRDTIHTPGAPEPLRDWGGLSYSLAAFEAARPPGWSVLPIVKVGEDVRASALELLSGLAFLDSLAGVRTVPEPNNRVEIRYGEGDGRTERLTGGVPGWTWDELAPLALSCDALYVNFIAGWELDLPCARELRAATASGGVPLYCDLHSLLLGVAEEGLRVRRPPPRWREWAGSFDLLQINADELETLGREAELDAPGLAARLVAGRTRALFVTRGREGVSWFASPGFRRHGLATTADRGESHAAGTAGPGGSGRTAPGEAVAPGEGPERGFVAAEPIGEAVDPTGCGDVWGMACFAALLGGARLDGAVELGNLLAGRNATRRGTSGLADALGEMLPEGGARWAR